MLNGVPCVPAPRNEPVLGYAPGSPERATLRAELSRMSTEVIEITPRIGGERVATGQRSEAVMPHNHRHVLAVWHRAGPRTSSVPSTARWRPSPSGHACRGSIAPPSS
jgi:1-pyrroline-5-carboxylate dehydrogenase